MRLFISVDMEGVAGVARWEQTQPGHPEWERCRRLMTDEVNAAIEGALDAGVREVVVNDAHWHGTNLLPELLNPVAELVSGSARPLSMCEGIGPGFDAAFFLGYHGSAGLSDANLAHTYADPKVVASIRLNGVEQSEGSINGYLCGHFGCPVALFTGDSTAVAQMREFVPEVEGVAVKHAIGTVAARTLPLPVVRERLRAGGRRAIETLSGIPAMRPPDGPIEVAIEFHHPSMADPPAGVPGVQRLDSRTVAYATPRYLDVFRMMKALVVLGESAG